MLTQDQRDLVEYLADRVNELTVSARDAAAGKARIIIDEAEELLAIRAAILDRHANNDDVVQLQLPLVDRQAA